MLVFLTHRRVRNISDEVSEHTSRTIWTFAFYHVWPTCHSVILCIKCLHTPWEHNMTRLRGVQKPRCWVKVWGGATFWKPPLKPPRKKIKCEVLYRCAGPIEVDKYLEAQLIICLIYGCSSCSAPHTWGVDGSRSIYSQITEDPRRPRLHSHNRINDYSNSEITFWLKRVGTVPTCLRYDYIISRSIVTLWIWCLKTSTLLQTQDKIQTVSTRHLHTAHEKIVQFVTGCWHFLAAQAFILPAGSCHSAFLAIGQSYNSIASVTVAVPLQNVSWKWQRNRMPTFTIESNQGSWAKSPLSPPSASRAGGGGVLGNIQSIR